MGRLFLICSWVSFAIGMPEVCVQPHFGARRIDCTIQLHPTPYWRQSTRVPTWATWTSTFSRPWTPCLLLPSA